MINLISAISMLFEYFISINYYNNLFELKLHKKTAYAMGFSLFTVFTLSFIFLQNKIVNILLYFIINLLFSFICYSSSLAKSALSSLFITAVMMGTEFLTLTFLSFSADRNINDYTQDVAICTITVIFSKTALFIISGLCSYFYLYFSNSKKQKTPLFLILFPLCSMVIFYAFWLIASQYHLTAPMQYVIASSVFVIILAIVLTYIFYGKTMKELDELYLKQREINRIKTDTSYYEILNRQNEQLKTILHDEKNHLTAIKALCDNEATKAYIDKLNEQIKCYSLFGNTGNKMLDLTVNKYQYICKTENIDFSVSIKTANLLYIDDPDLIALLGNILDNAVEAAKTSKTKRIELSINKANNFDILTCINTSEQKPTAVNRLLKSRKENRSVHGFGIKSIKRITEKYNGLFDWSYNEQDKEFSVYISFNSTQ